MALIAIWRKYLKLWLGISAASNNAFVYMWLESCSMSDGINEVLFNKYFGNLYPPYLHGLVIDKTDFKGRSTSVWEAVSSYMWYGFHHFSPPMDKNFQKSETFF